MVEIFFTIVGNSKAVIVLCQCLLYYVRSFWNLLLHPIIPRSWIYAPSFLFIFNGDHFKIFICRQSRLRFESVHMNLYYLFIYFLIFNHVLLYFIMSKNILLVNIKALSNLSAIPVFQCNFFSYNSNFFSIVSFSNPLLWEWLT